MSISLKCTNLPHLSVSSEISRAKHRDNMTLLQICGVAITCVTSDSVQNNC